MELPVGIEKIDKTAFEKCFSLRNLAIPPNAQSHQSLHHRSVSYKECDLLKLFGSHQVIFDALKSRFDGLPIHRLCYYQSHYPAEVTIDQLKIFMTEKNSEASLAADSDTSGRVGERKRAANWSGGGSSARARHSEDATNASVSKSDAAIDSYSSPANVYNIVDNNQEDCLGMTPLHILACSSKQDLDLYRFIFASQPDSLIAEDKWGCPPLLYAIWGGAPQDIIQFLVSSQKAALSRTTFGLG